MRSMVFFLRRKGLMKDRGFLTPVTENFLHAFGVGKVSFDLALKYGEDPQSAFIAGCLHDLGGAVPNNDRVEVAESLGIELFEEERKIPLLVHAKLGRYFARTLFDIQNVDVLDAILYHTTCIDNASTLVKIVFLADKIHWDRNGIPPYLNGLLKALEISLDQACEYFIRWLWDSELYIVHPFLLRSYDYYVNKNPNPRKDVYFREESLPKLSKELIEKYYLVEIKNEFVRTFVMGEKAVEFYTEARGEEPSEKAYLAAVLSNCLNTVTNLELRDIALHVGLTSTQNLEIIREKLTCYFAKEEYKIYDSSILNTLSHHRHGENVKDEVCVAVNRAYEYVNNSTRIGECNE